jgi:type III pantothenate kinase
VVVDIGNTSTSAALAQNGRIRFMRFQKSRTLTTPAAVRRFIGPLARKRPLDGSVLSSVVPTMNRVWISELRRATGRRPIVVNHKLRLGVKIDYPKPATIGADRLANACAAADRYGVPVIVADFGTAVTFDIVSPKGAYVGGVIAPGLPLMTEYLYERTALLPMIHLKGPHGIVGRSTIEAMQLGAKVGYRGMVREIVAFLQAGFHRRFKLCATGGFARWALEGLNLPFTIAPDLTLYGLSRIYDLNQNTGRTRRRRNRGM